MAMIASALLLAIAPALLSVDVSAAVQAQPLSLTAAAASAASRHAFATPVGQSTVPAPRDSLKNGAIIGVAIGAATGAILASYGCGGGELLSPFPEEESCTSQTIVGAVVGAGLGALIGAGVDALFERAPHVGTPTRRIPRGLQVRMRF